MIPVMGFATVSRFDLAERLLASIDYPIEHLVIVDNSGKQSWNPAKPPLVENIWVIRVPFGLGLVGAWNLIIKSTPYAPYWLLINDDAWFEPGALRIIDDTADPTKLGHPVCEPRWSAIVLGETVVQRAGLYDERFYPLYYDDNDYERRIDAAGIETYIVPALIHHDNSASINHTYNNVSFINNQRLHERKTLEQDNTWTWTLQTRRRNRWD